MPLTPLLRTACAGLLLCVISSFSGCEKTGDAQPRTGKGCHKTTTTASDTTKTGAS